MTYISRASVKKYTEPGEISRDYDIINLAGDGADAMTISDPDVAEDGKIIHIVASTAQAFTVTYTAGFKGTTTSSDVATFGGAKGDSMTIVALGGVWLAINVNGVTIA